jgi:hypothetical protein
VSTNRCLPTLAVLLALVLALSSAPAAIAMTGKKGRSPVVVHVHLKRFSSQEFQQVWTSGNFTVLVGEHSSVLINDRTGKQTRLSQPGCSAAIAIGVPWVLFQCADDFSLYDVSTRRWSTVTCGERCLEAVTQSLAIEIGRRWIEIVETGHGDCGDGEHETCGPETYLFKNIRTGELRSAPSPTASQVRDLDSPSLVRNLCPPLRVPEVGSLMSLVDGGFGLVSDSTGSFLERCHSRLHLRVPAVDLLWSNSKMLLWRTAEPPKQYDGLFLPSLRRFVFKVPAPFARTGLTIFDVLASNKLYILDAVRGRVWTAAMPSSPPG